MNEDSAVRTNRIATQPFRFPQEKTLPTVRPAAPRISPASFSAFALTFPAGASFATLWKLAAASRIEALSPAPSAAASRDDDSCRLASPPDSASLSRD
jgi:hypothetical protein